MCHKFVAVSSQPAGLRQGRDASSRLAPKLMPLNAARVRSEGSYPAPLKRVQADVLM